MRKVSQFSLPAWYKEEKPRAFVFILSGSCINIAGIETFLKDVLKQDSKVETVKSVEANLVETVCHLTPYDAWNVFTQLLEKFADDGVDVAVIPQSERVKKLLVCDMDSTIVAGETLDDVADKIGVGKQVKHITERAMRGELDFKQALNERISLLKDISENVIREVAGEVNFNPGAEQLIKDCKENQIRTVLVSGGFEPIVKAAAEKLGFDRYVCNKLEIAEGKLTGRVVAPIVDGSIKLNVLKEESQKLGIGLLETCAVGDGANDLPMLQASGLGLAYRGKPILRKSLPYQINACGLDFISVIMGIAD